MATHNHHHHPHRHSYDVITCKYSRNDGSQLASSLPVVPPSEPELVADANQRLCAAAALVLQYSALKTSVRPSWRYMAAYSIKGPMRSFFTICVQGRGIDGKISKRRYVLVKFGGVETKPREENYLMKVAVSPS